MIRVAVNGIIFDKDGSSVLLTKRQDVDLWCLPGGLLEKGENFEEAIEREVFEEIGVRINNLELKGIYSQPNVKIVAPMKAHIVIVSFRCDISEGTPVTSDEVREVAYFSIGNLPQDIIHTHPERIFDALDVGVVCK